MKNPTDYLYYRQLYSNQYYSKRGFFEIQLKNGNIRYLFFDRDKHIKFTDKKQYASKFNRKPKNYENYINYIKKYYGDVIINYVEEVVVRNKYE